MRVERRTFQVRGRPVQEEFLAYPDAVTVVATDEQGRFLLVRQYRPAVDTATFEFPAGKCEPGEAPAAAAVRELAEETGFRAERWRPLLAFYTAPGHCSQTVWGFRAEGLRPGAVRPDPEEDVEVLWFTAAECEERMRRGEIRDAKTVLLFLSLLSGWDGGAAREGPAGRNGPGEAEAGAT